LAAAGSLGRRPAIAHVLWLLVLLRLFAPPVWRVTLPQWRADPVRVANEAAPPTQLPPAAPPLTHEFAAVPNLAAPPPPPAAPPGAALTGPVIVVTIWLGGSALCLGVALTRGWRFHRTLRFAEPAPSAWQTTCDRLARRVGLRRWPSVWLVPGPV